MNQDPKFTNTPDDVPASEPRADALALVPSNGHGIKRCSFCHTENTNDANNCRQCGCFLAANTVNPIKHGGRTRRPLVEPESTELFQTWAVDLGGVDALTAGQRVLLQRAAEAHVICQTAFQYLLNTGGSWTGRHVQIALQTLATHSNTIFRVAALLGIRREHVPRNPLDAVRQAVEEANK